MLVFNYLSRGIQVFVRRKSFATVVLDSAVKPRDGGGVVLVSLGGYMMFLSYFDMQKIKRYFILSLVIGIMVLFLLWSVDAAAQQESLGQVAQRLRENFSNLARLISSLAWVGGAGFTVGAILKFKQHKDNPTQIPIGTPIALLLVGASLLFLPTILEVTGASLFTGTPRVGGAQGCIKGLEGGVGCPN